MRSKEVIALLRVSRPTLTKYVNEQRIRTIKLPNGQYEYNDEDVYHIFNKGIPRQTVIYGRVSDRKQKQDLESQMQILKQFCLANGYVISALYQDIASGIDFEKRKHFFEMLDLILSGRVERVVITYKDRLSRVGFNLFAYLFKHFHCDIVVMSEVGNPKLDSQEIFEEIISFLHCYSMKLYSKRRLSRIKAALSEEEV